MASTTTYSWDEENRLTSVTLPSGGSEEYSYAADGLRRSKTKGTQTTRFLWDEENLLQEQSGFQTIAHYTNQPDGYGPLLSQRRSDGGSTPAAQFNAVGFGSSGFNQSGSTSSTSASSFYGFDFSANTRVLTDESGGVSDSYVSTAFGKPIASSGSANNPYRFGGEVGYYKDNDERSYVRARHYSHSQGRWISKDPIGFNARDWNLYRYVQNKPISMIDPTGLESSNRCKNCPFCGPEVAKNLNQVLKQVAADFQSWGDDKKFRACAALTSIQTAAGAWDIFELNTAIRDAPIDTQSSRTFRRMVRASGCATGHCANTVMIKGQCHPQWAVNYALFGTMFNLCRRLPRKYAEMLPVATTAACPVGMEKGNSQTHPQVYIEYYFARSRAECFVHKFNNAMARANAKYSPKDAYPKSAWMRAGFHGGVLGHIVPPTKYRRSGCNKCKPSKILQHALASIVWGYHWTNGTAGE